MCFHSRKKYQAGSNEFIYLHDECGPHRAKKVPAFFGANGLEVLPWPAQSPDLNPIEHVWSIMKLRLRLLQNYLTTREKLFEHLCTIWNELPETYLSNLVWSLSSRCTDVKDVSGKSNEY